MISLTPPENFRQKFYVVSCFIEHNGKFLMLLRNDDKSEGNKWGTPAGKREPDESEIDALLREVFEETGILLVREQIIKSVPVYVRYPDYDYTFHMFSAQLDEKPAVILSPTEHKDFQWVSPLEALETRYVLDEDQCIKLFYDMN